MKKIISVLCILALAASLFALAGCGGTKEIPADSAYIGTWEAVRAEMMGEETPMEEVLEGNDWFFDLKADGTAVERSGDDSETGTWWLTKDGIKVKIGDSKAVKLTMEGDNLVIKMVAKVFFEKKA